MPIHEDDPARAGNLTDEEYLAALQERMEDGELHVIPEHYLETAEARLAELDLSLRDEDEGTKLAMALPGSPITYMASSWLTSYGPFSGSRPWARVLHSLECNPNPGIARELSAPGGWLDNEGLAPHGMSDPTQRVRACNTNRYSGHVGARANPLVAGYEVAGRAGNSRAQWMDGGNQQAALESDARLIAWDYVQDGWSRAEIRMLSGAQIKTNYNGGSIVRGLMTHNDVSQFIGGTNHWDPGPNFPFTWFLDRVRSYYDEFTGGKGTQPAKPITTTPVPEDYNVMRTFTVAGYHPVIGYGPGLFVHLNEGQLAEGKRLKQIEQGGPTTLARADQVQAWAMSFTDGVENSRNVVGKASTYLRAHPSGGTTPTTVKYPVKAGDTFTSIATAHKITVDALKKLNPQVTDINAINVGDQLNVPK